MRWLIGLGLYLWLLAVPAHAAVVINEVLPDPTGTDVGNEWVELYNDSNGPVDLTGYELEDKTGDRFELSGVITRWLVVYPQGGGFALTNTGSVAIKLFEPGQSEPIDSFDYDGSSEGKSWGRIPDGGEISSDKLTPTAGTANAPIPTPTATPTPTPTPTPTSTPTVKPTAVPTATTPTPKATAGAAPKPTAAAQILAATVAAEIAETPTATPSATPQPEVKKQGKWPWLMMIGGGGVAVAALFPFLRKWYHDPSWLKTLLKGGDRSSFGQE